MAAEREDAATVPGGRLDDRVLTALQELHGRIAFNGLRRALGAHPESLSRALHRLEREGLVDRSTGGYRSLVGPPEADPTSATPLRPIAHVRVPDGTSPDSVLGRLSGRWFGTLRWVGVIDRPSQRLFAWARRDGSGYVLLGIHDRNLRVYIPDDPGPGDLAEAEDAAYELLGHAVGALRPPASEDGSLFFRAETNAPSAVSPDN
jgi:hypothetical protein